MDFVSAFPRMLVGNEVAWVIVDKLTQLAHFIPFRVGCLLEKLVQLYVREIVWLHDIPKRQLQIETLIL